ncbi:MAG: ABC transporter permease [Chloroflexi bacterium]|nr:ABC transporter permease [Chloroflexota bacterium]
MQRFLVVRVFQTMIALLAVTVIVFGLGRVTGDPLDVLLPAEATQADYEVVRAVWGLDKPIYEQYVVFLKNAVTGNFGQSWKWNGQTAMGLVMDRLPATLMLAGVAVVVATALAVPLGVLSAVKKDSVFDFTGKIVALLGQSLPAFWLGIVLMWIFAVELGWVPTSGRTGLVSFILPAVSIGWFQVAALMRLVRSSMLDVLDSEYVKLARIKGVTERKVIWKHCLRNAAIAPLTYFGIILGGLMVGSVSIETVFSWPGVGLLAVEAARARDFQVLQAVVIVFSSIYILANLAVDIAYAYLDPRIRYS